MSDECTGCFPPLDEGEHFWDCPTGITLKVLAAHERGIAEGVRAERQRVVAWLRDPNDAAKMVAAIYRCAADIIERGEHAKDEVTK